MNASGGQRRRERGFSLIEVMAAMGILVIIIFAFSAYTISSTRFANFNNKATIAATLAQDRLESLKTLSFSDPNLSAGNHADPLNPLNAEGENASNGPFTRSWTVTDNAPAPGLKTLTVTVAWRDFANHSQSITTYVRR